MKRQFLITLLLLVFANVLLGQTDCEWKNEANVNNRPDVLSLLTGDSGNKIAESDKPGLHSVFILINAGDNESAAGLLDQLYPLNPEGDSTTNFFNTSNSVARLLLGDYKNASLGLSDGSGNICGERNLALITGYLGKYGTRKPMFSHFTGGFYNFLQDSLGWEKDKPNGGEYNEILNDIYSLIVIQRANDPLMLEIFGDLLQFHPDPFTRNYFGCLVFLKASMVTEGKTAAIYEDKAAHAIEYPKMHPKQFDPYRFSQLKEMMTEESGNGNGKTAKYGPSLTFMSGEPAGRLGERLLFAQQRVAEQDAGKKKFADEVDPKEVKKDATFNIYGLVMILVIVGMVTFIWVRLLRSSRAAKGNS